MNVYRGNVNIVQGGGVQVLGDVEISLNTGIENNGDLHLTGDWVNNSQDSGLINQGEGNVALNGNYQEISGDSPTYFSTLILQTNQSVKASQIETYITRFFQINDVIYQTNQFNTHVLNPTTNAVSWSTGFIESSQLAGNILRSTNTDSSYFFPVGSQTISNNLRAIEVQPSSNDSNVFAVRLGVQDASLEVGTSLAGSIAPFDRESKEITIGDINPIYYHNVSQPFGNQPADISLYHMSQDGNGAFTALAGWNVSTSSWDEVSVSMNPVTSNLFLGNPDRKADFLLSANTNDDVYALASLAVTAPTGFTPNGDGINDVFFVKGLENFPDNELYVYNRWGQLIYEAKPYANDWNGINTSGAVKIQGDEVDEDTYFYILKLSEDMDPIKNYVDIVKD